MKQLIFRSVFLILLASQAFGQQNHFIYLQSDNREPFYVLLNKKTYSSTNIGYIILPKLVNGEYKLRIGFAKSADTEQDYIINVVDNEQGYLIKDFGEKGWALFNMQSLQVQYSGVARKEQESVALLKQAREKEITDSIAAETRKAELALAAQVKKQADDSLLNETKKAEALAVSKKAAEDSITKAVATTMPTTTPKVVTPVVEPVKTTVEKQVVPPNILDAGTNSNSTANPNGITVAPEIKKEPETPKTVVEVPKAALIHPMLIATQKTDLGISYKYSVQNTDGTDTVNVYILGTDNTKTDPPADTKLVTDSVVETAKPIAVAVVDTAMPNKVESIEKVESHAETVTVPKKDPVKFLPMDFKVDSVKHDSEMVVPVFNTQAAKKDTSEQIKKPDSGEEAIKKINPEIKKVDEPIIKKDSIPATIAVIPGKMEIPNSNCKAVADDKDFFNLRKKMAAEEGTDEMIFLARKAMKEKCYTTTQIRNLSVLFLSDADKYQFLDAAYPFAQDAYQYEILGDVLKETYYIQRFKTMLRK